MSTGMVGAANTSTPSYAMMDDVNGLRQSWPKAPRKTGELDEGLGMQQCRTYTAGSAVGASTQLVAMIFAMLKARQRQLCRQQGMTQIGH